MMAAQTVPPPFDPKIFQSTRNIYVFGDHTVSGEYDSTVSGEYGLFHPRCCWLVPPNGEHFSYSRPSKRWQLEPYAEGALPVSGSPKKLYAIFTAYLLTGHWPTYAKGYPR